MRPREQLQMFDLSMTEEQRALVEGKGHEVPAESLPPIGDQLDMFAVAALGGSIG